MQLALRNRLESCKTLPMLPGVAVHVLRLVERDNFDMSDVARAVNGDSTLANKVLRLINSPLFGLRQEVRTVNHALVLLGVNAIRTIALSFAIVDDLRARDRNSAEHAVYWRRAVLSAVAAQELARSDRLPHPEEAFLAGLLQDIGVLALEQAVPDVAGPLAIEARGDHARRIALETTAFGCDHAEVGRWLLTSWRLPETVRAAVGSSHDPNRWSRGADSATVTLTSVVALSGCFADVWVLDPLRAAVALRHRAEELLGMTVDRVSAVLSRIAAVFLDIAPMFGLPADLAESVNAALDKAQLALRDDPLTSDSAETMEGEIVARPAGRRDPLTGLASRRRFDEYLAEQFTIASEVGKPLSVILCDVDELKMVNETFGKEAGDRALISIGAQLSERLRHRDLAARFGGEEFALVLQDTHAAGAAVVAERLRRRVEETAHDIGLGDPIRLTISLGCVTLDETLAFPSPVELIGAVEETLSRAKRAGRNRVVAHSAERREPVSPSGDDR